MIVKVFDKEVNEVLYALGGHGVYHKEVKESNFTDSLHLY
jgi:hypothetical protein